MSKTKEGGALKAKQQLETKTFEAYPEWRRQLMISADENAPAVAPVAGSRMGKITIALGAARPCRQTRRDNVAAQRLRALWTKR